MTISRRAAALLVAFTLLAAGSAIARGLIQSPQLLDKVKPGMTAAEVEQILGPPVRRTNWPRQERVSMDYVMQGWDATYDVAVMLDKGDIVREVQKVRRFPGF